MVTGMWWLTALWAVPMAGGAAVILLPATARAFARWAAFAVSLVVFAIALMLTLRFDPAGARYQFV
ncbi:MAG: NADH-quinone oxidoreductase subunit M, partial [Actinobacteria bacterium]|nr:NADH-quinone oxidoreductase subunit M [Actinomycetota bacterium]